MKNLRYVCILYNKDVSKSVNKWKWKWKYGWKLFYTSICQRPIGLTHLVSSFHLVVSKEYSEKNVLVIGAQTETAMRKMLFYCEIRQTATVLQFNVLPKVNMKLDHGNCLEHRTDWDQFHSGHGKTKKKKAKKATTTTTTRRRE